MWPNYLQTNFYNSSAAYNLNNYNRLRSQVSQNDQSEMPCFRSQEESSYQGFSNQGSSEYNVMGNDVFESEAPQHYPYQENSRQTHHLYPSSPPRVVSNSPSPVPNTVSNNWRFGYNQPYSEHVIQSTSIEPSGDDGWDAHYKHYGRNVWVGEYFTSEGARQAAIISYLEKNGAGRREAREMCEHIMNSMLEKKR
jgi:hypothetical protein